MRYITIPKKLLLEYARKLSPNAVMCLAGMFDYLGFMQIYDFRSSDRLLVEVDDYIVYKTDEEIARLVEINVTHINKYLKELIKAGLIILGDYYYDDCEPRLLSFISDKRKSKGDVCYYSVDEDLYDSMLEYGYIKVPKELLSDTILKAPEKVLYILHLILSENYGYCYAGRKYLSELMGVDEKTITRLNKKLEQAGYIVKETSTKVIKNNIKTNCIYTPKLRVERSSFIR